jgi:hypothetical protein
MVEAYSIPSRPHLRTRYLTHLPESSNSPRSNQCQRGPGELGPSLVSQSAHDSALRAFLRAAILVAQILRER